MRTNQEALGRTNCSMDCHVPRDLIACELAGFVNSIARPTLATIITLTVLLKTFEIQGDI